MNVHSPKVINYEVVTANNPITKNYFDQDDFYPADGSEFSNAIGDRRARKSNTRARKVNRQKGGFFQKLVDYTPIGMIKKGADRRALRKQTEANAQLAASRGIGKDSKADIALAQSLGSAGRTRRPAPKKGLSTIAWVGIGVGALALVGLTIFLVKRKK